MGPLLVVLALIFLTASPSAWATFPGRNGQLAFTAYTLSEESSDFMVDESVVGIARLPRGPRRVFALGTAPAFSPDGRRLAYEADRDEAAPGIWVTRPGCRWPPQRSAPPPCSVLRRLTTNDKDRWPVWSPDGKRIAFTRVIGSPPFPIYSVGARGGGLRLLAHGYNPDWSSTGALAFETGVEEHLAVRYPGGRIRRLSDFGADPSWSPTGDRLAFVGYDNAAEKYALYLINADGTARRKVWQNPHGDELPGRPAWSPDGRSIAFIRHYGSETRRGPVSVIRPSGRGLRVLIRRLPRCPFCDGTLQGFDDLAWQPLP